jgi:hypothetical protein
MATKVPNRMLAFDGGNFPFRNKLINGNFDIWQRGTTFNAVADNTYTADRWDFTFDNGGTRNITRQAFTRGQTDVPNNPFYFLSVQQTVAGTSAPQKFNALVQRMEDSRLLSGKKVVLTFWAKVSTPFNSAISLQQWFGTGGSPSPQVVHNSPEFQITTTWQKFTINFELSSVSGKVLGTNPDTDFLQVAFRLPLDSTFTFDVAQVQLEEGSFATPFEQRPIGTELALCQRYFCKSFNVNVSPGHNIVPGMLASHEPIASNTTSGGTIHIGQGKFPVTMRTTPTIVFYNPNAVETVINRVYLTSTINNRGTVTSYMASQERLSYFLVTSTRSGAEPTSSIRACHWQFTADAEL